MSNHIQKKSTHYYWVLVLAAIIILAAGSAFMYHQLSQNAAKTQAEQEAAHLSYDIALINACLPQIEEAVEDFYADYLSIPPTVTNYVTTLQNVTTDKNGNNATIILTVSPYVGPHEPVGSDQITLAVRCDGSIIVQDYQHLSNCALPDNLADLIIQPLPDGQK